MSDLTHDANLIRSPDGTAIAVRVWGGGPGIPLLIANGIGAGPSLWRGTLAGHTGLRKIVTWDHRGLHDSGSAPEGRLGPSDHAGDAVAALDHAQVESCVVVAWSSGGRIALQVAADHPERVAGAVLVCAGYGHSLGRLLHLEFGPLLPRLAGLAKPFAGPLQGFFEGFVARPEIAGLIRQSGLVGASADTGALIEFLQGLSGCDARVLLETYEKVSGSPAPELLAAIGAPSLVIAGDRDRFATPQMMNAIAEELPAGRLTVYEGATHLLPIEFPGRLSTDLASFCSEIERLTS